MAFKQSRHLKQPSSDTYRQAAGLAHESCVSTALITSTVLVSEVTVLAVESMLENSIRSNLGWMAVTGCVGGVVAYRFRKAEILLTREAEAAEANEPYRTDANHGKIDE